MDAQPVKTSRNVRITRIDEEQRIVTGAVYSPMVRDTYGDFMTADDILTMYQRWGKLTDTDQRIDTQHDNKANGCYPIADWIVKEDDKDPDFPVGTWVMSVKCAADDIWKKVKEHKINGFSFEAWCVKRTKVVEVADIDDQWGLTQEAEDHAHFYFVRLDAKGTVTGGRTSRATDGHYHKIKHGTVTQAAQGHKHRFRLG